MILSEKYLKTALNLACTLILALVLLGSLTSCNAQKNIVSQQDNYEDIEQPEANLSCPAIASRNWQAEIKTNGDNEPSLIITGEIDLPTPGYQVTWQPETSDLQEASTQRIGISLLPPEGIVIQVITPTAVSFTMPSALPEYSSVMVYCGEQLLAEISNIEP